jgi:hypothetical protein
MSSNATPTLICEHTANGLIYACLEKQCRPGLHAHQDRPYLIVSKPRNPLEMFRGGKWKKR